MGGFQVGGGGGAHSVGKLQGLGSSGMAGGKDMENHKYL
jgi:hypothetical protein